MASRTQVAHYVSGKLATNRTEAIKAAAAWLVATGRGRQSSYLARDIATLLADNGHLLVNVTTARPLTDAARSAITVFLQTETGAATVELTETIDTSLIGGVRLETPTAQLDSTIRYRLARLVEGA